MALAVDTPEVAVGPTDGEAVARASTDPLSRWVLAGLAGLFLLVAFVQEPGQIVDDTKLPVVMAPLAWMRASLHLWSPAVASGSVQSETSGYLVPMAPFFELMHLLHIPVWFGERLWLALLLTVGAWGVVRLAEALGIGVRWARVLGALAYCVAPLVVDWAAISVDLLAVVLLPWVLHPLVVASRQGSTRRGAARSGVAVALMGGVNATVIVATLPLGVLWLLTRTPGRRRRSLAGWWVVSIGLACFWWVAATALEGKYGYNYLPYTETSTVTTATGSAFEAIRGASYWQNYDDLGGPLIRGGWTLVSSGFAIMATSVVAAMGLAGLARKIPERLFLVASLCVGVLVIGVGYDGTFGGPFAHQIQTLLAGGFGPLRNIAKFAPDVALPLALGLIWLVSTLRLADLTARWPALTAVGVRRAVAVVAVVAVFGAAVPFWQQELYPTGGFAAIPAYWTHAADWLDSHQGRQTALLVPGASFADYTWGRPQDEPLAVLAGTSTTVRSIIPLGSDGNTDMLSTVEAVLERGTPDAGLADYLARSGVDYVVERNDLNLAETGAPPPAQVHQVLTQTPGLVEVAAFGPYLPRSQVAQGDLPVYDSASSVHLRPVEIFRVEPATSDVQTFAASDPVVVSGSSDSLLALADTVLPGRAAVLAKDQASSVAAKQPGATLAITDGNQRRAIAFGTIQDDVSYLLGAGQRPEGLNPSTPLVYGSLGPTDAQTVAAPIGVASVSATSYGSSPLHPEPLQGPAAAFDDNRSTAWVATGVDNSIYQSLSVTFDKPEYVTRIAITPLNDSPDRPSIENVDIKTDQGLVHRFVPRTNAPVWLTVAPGETRHLKIVIRMVRRPRKRQDPPLGAGITQVTIPGVTFQPAMRLPTVELATFSQPGRKPPVVSVSDPVANPNLDFTGPTSSTPPITRIVDLPSRLNATSTGTVVPNPGADLTAVVNEAEAPMDLQVHAVASSSLRDLPKFGAENLVVRSATPWIAGMNDGRPSVTLRWSGVRSVSSLVFGLTSLASRPTRLLITSTVGSRTVAVPRTGGTISFAPLVTDSLTIHVVSVAVKRGIVPTGSRTAGFPRPKPVVLPVGLASVTVPAVGGQQPVPPVDPATSVAIPCGDGPTVDIDGASHPTEVSGTLGNLVDLQPMAFHLCPSSTELAAGRHTLSFPSSSAFRVTGLLLQPSGSAARSGHATPVRTLHVTSWAPASRSVVVGAGPTTFLQVAQNINRGWTATLYGRTLTPVTLDGWQQGWVIPAGASGTIIMTFGPDRTFRAALALGALFLLVLLVLALVGGEGTASEPVGRRRRIPQWLVVVGAAVVVSGVGGALALVLLPLVLVGRRWGTRWLAAMSGAAFALAGLIVAVDPNTVVDYSSGAFGAPAQILSVVALCAVLAVVVVEEAR